MKRTLTLKRETLTTLTADELGSVAGAADHTIPNPECVTAILREDITQYLDLPQVTPKCV